jgi:hypothetical protein
MLKFGVKLAQGRNPPLLCLCAIVHARRCVCATNDHDRQLLAFCEDYDMALCTGRTLSDKDALPTRVSFVTCGLAIDWSLRPDVGYLSQV